MALLKQTMTLPPPKESNFNLSTKHRTDIFIGMATPVYSADLVPGDIINISARAKMISDALAVPCLGQMRLQMDHFFVPYRILWNKWTDFIRQGEDSSISLPCYSVCPINSSQQSQLNDVTSSINFADYKIYPDLFVPKSVQRTDSLGEGQYVNEYITSADLEEHYLPNEIEATFNYPWINGYQEQEFTYAKYQNIPSVDAFEQGTSPVVTGIPVSGNTPFNIVRPNSLVNYLELPVGYFGEFSNSYARHPLFKVLAYNKIWYEWYRNPQEDSYAFFGDNASIFINEANISVTTTSPFNVIFSNQEMEEAIDFVNSSSYSNSIFNSNDLSLAEVDDSVHRIRKFLFSLKKRCFKHDYLSSVLNANNYDNATAVVNVSSNQFTINQWRQALHVDKYQKRTYLGGDRYIDWIRAQFGVIDSDARLQRPELLSSISSEVIFVDVESKASTESASLGQLASRGITMNEQPENVKFRATEHGVYMVICSLVPIVDDLYGISKFSRKTDVFDYFVPALDNIDMQPVHTYEYSVSDDVAMALADDRLLSILSSGTDSNAWTSRWNAYFANHEMAYRALDQTFNNTFDSPVGYLPAWTEYKTSLNRVSGTLSSQRKDYVLSRPNPFHNQLELVDYNTYDIISQNNFQYEAEPYTYVGEFKDKPTWVNLNLSGTKQSILPEFTDNYMNNVYISQYVDFRDFAYLWPDTTGRYPTNVLQLAFNVVARRPMSKWSLPI